jgi:protein-L-isoaspartate(D-aspartate) O-methyltransferase
MLFAGKRCIERALGIRRNDARALQAYLGNSNIHHPARHYPRRVLAYTLMKKFLLLAFITVACDAMAQDGQCVRERAAMVETIRAYARSEADVLGPQGISQRVLEVMGQAERHRFSPGGACSVAYMDAPILIGHDQTMSQPFIVALMTHLAALKFDDTVLEVGTGSGYQAAVLARLARKVCTVEIVPPLAEAAARVLRELGYDNVSVKVGDGYLGWPECGPFDAIIGRLHLTISRRR